MPDHKYRLLNRSRSSSEPLHYGVKGVILIRGLIACICLLASFALLCSIYACCLKDLCEYWKPAPHEPVPHTSQRHLHSPHLCFGDAEEYLRDELQLQLREAWILAFSRIHLVSPQHPWDMNQ